VAAGAEQLEVAELVAAAVAERHTVMYLEPVARAAADAGSVEGVDGGAVFAPLPAAPDLAARLPVVAAARAVGAA
jgi:hypothetical protein